MMNNIVFDVFNCMRKTVDIMIFENFKRNIYFLNILYLLCLKNIFNDINMHVCTKYVVTVISLQTLLTTLLTGITLHDVI